jgi:hypothetical protein
MSNLLISKSMHYYIKRSRYLCLLHNKRLKIPKGYLQTVIRGRIDNIIAERERTNNDLENIHIKLMIEQLEPH